MPVRFLRLVRGTYRYQSHQNAWTELRARIREIAQSRVRYGYRKILVLLLREGWQVGKHLVYRLYKEEGLALKKRPQKRRKAVRHREERFRPTAPDQAWSLDFVADQLQDGRRCRSLTIVDVFTRESVAIEVGQSLRGEDVVRTLNKLKHEGRVPKLLFCDNGSEFAGQAMDLWAYQNSAKIDFSRPGKPTDNHYVAYCTSLDGCGKISGGSCSKLELDALLFPRWVVEWFIERLALICIAKSFQQSVSAPDLYCFRVDAAGAQPSPLRSAYLPVVKRS